MSKSNGNIPGTYISGKDLTDLNEVLTTFRDYILKHEAELTLVKEWISEFHKTQAPVQEAAEDGATETTPEEATTETSVDESPNDPS